MLQRIGSFCDTANRKTVKATVVAYEGVQAAERQDTCVAVAACRTAPVGDTISAEVQSSAVAVRVAAAGSWQHQIISEKQCSAVVNRVPKISRPGSNHVLGVVVNNPTH